MCQKNSVYGIVFYASMIPLTLVRNTFTAEILMFMSFSSIGMSVYLSYVLFMMKNFCIVCFATHCINVYLLIKNWQSRRLIMAEVYADIDKKNNWFKYLLSDYFFTSAISNIVLRVFNYKF